MAECAAVCEHAHLPLQSGSTRILKAMRRTYSRERYLKLATICAPAIPDLALATDIIVGFPGETEDDFRETIEVVEEVGFDSAFTFVYSPRHGTEAAAMTDQVPDEVKRDRIERLVEVVQRVAAERNNERVGRVEEVLVEGPQPDRPSILRGRTRRNTTVNFSRRRCTGRARRRADRARDVHDARRCRSPSAAGSDRQPEVEDPVGEDGDHRGGERDPHHESANGSSARPRRLRRTAVSAASARSRSRIRAAGARCSASRA